MHQHSYIKPFSFFLFIIFNNYVLYDYILVPIFYNQQGNSFYLIFFFAIILNILFAFLLSNRKLKTNLKEKLLKSKVRYIVAIYFFISSFIIALITARSIAAGYYYNVNAIIFFLAIIFIAMSIAGVKEEGIINISTIPFLIMIPLFILCTVLNMSIKDFTEILPINWSFSKSLSILMAIYIVIDNYIYLLCNDHKEKKNGKWTIVMANIVFLVLMLIQSINLIALTGGKFLSNYELIGFTVYNVQPTLKYLGNLDFIYIYLLLICSVFKIAFNLTLFKDIFKSKSKTFFIPYFILFLILGLVCYNYYDFILKYKQYMVYLLLVLYFPYILFLIFQKRAKLNE